MSAKLIINADDFGLTGGVNRSVSELAVSGALTSATLMAKSAAFDQAVRIAKDLPGLGVGCHIVLTDGTPVSPPETIPTLLGKDGRCFRKSLLRFWIAVLLGRVDAAEMEREGAAQIFKLQDAGIKVTHVDTHKHTHVLPQVARAVLNAAERCGVHAVRNPFEREWSLKLSHGNLKRRLQLRLMATLRKRFNALPQIVKGSLVTTAGTIGISATGRLDSTTLKSLLRNVPEGTWELVCHPGYNDRELDGIDTRLRDTRDVERKALLEAFTETSSHPFPFELIHYGMLQTANHSSQIDDTAAHS